MNLPHQLSCAVASAFALAPLQAADHANREDGHPTMTRKPNILLITADDMNWDAVGAYGCPVRGTTPNIDRLANEGIRFDHAHVTVAVCQPSRSVLLTGRYPHRSGGEGFFHLRVPGVPTLPEVLRTDGYQVGILGKVRHSTPYGDFQWDMDYDHLKLGHGRNPSVYRKYAEGFFAQSRESNRPFFLMLNSHDPHRPFFGNDQEEWYRPGAKPAPAVAPSRVFSPGEVTTPGFLPDLPEVRREIAEYYSSVRRCDDTVGAALGLLKEMGLEENTIVIFLSDNGMAFPFSKTNCYLQSTRTPWIMRWPGKIRPDVVDRTHFISGIDLMPTLLDAVGIAPPPGMDGTSFLSLLRGENQAGRDFVFTQFHQAAGKRNYPMRGIQNRRFGYIVNFWSDGSRVFKNESQTGRTFEAMKKAAATEPKVAERTEMFLHRVPEEFYDLENDPDALHNLIDDPKYADEVKSMRNRLEQWMEETSDPALSAFRNRESPGAWEQFMKESAERLGGNP